MCRRGIIFSQVGNVSRLYRQPALSVGWGAKLQLYAEALRTLAPWRLRGNILYSLKKNFTNSLTSPLTDLSRMKGFYLLFISFLLCTQAFAGENGFHLQGHLKGYDGFIYLKYSNLNGDWTKDSCRVVNGTFHFTGEVNRYTAIAYIYANEIADDIMYEPTAAKIELENSVLNIYLIYNHFKDYVMTGCRSCEEYKGYSHSLTPLTKRLAVLKKISAQHMPKNRADSVEHAINILLTRIAARHRSYALRHPGSNVSTRELFEWNTSFTNAQLQRFYDRMPATQQQSYYGLKLKGAIDENLARINQASGIAPPFSALDVNGNLLTLDSLVKDNYILLDFWASWCVPCRNSHPGLKRLYAKYHPRGLEILGIADDDKEVQNWKSAIAADSIGIWKHILRGHNENIKNNPADLHRLYHVEFMPLKILINKKGIILGRLEDEESLEKKLQEVFPD